MICKSVRHSNVNFKHFVFTRNISNLPSSSSTPIPLFFPENKVFKSELVKKLRFSYNLEQTNTKTLLIEKVFSLKKSRTVNGKVLEEITKFVHSSNVSDLNAKEYCIVLGYYVDCKTGPDPIFKIMAELLLNPKFASTFSQQGVATTLNAFSKIGGPYDPPFSVFSDIIVSNCKFRSKFIPQAISMTLRAYAIHGKHSEDVFKSLGELMLTKPSLLRKFNCQGLATTLNSYIKLRMANTELFNAISKRIQNDSQFLADLNSQDISLIANAYSKSTVYDEQMLKTLLNVIHLNHQLVLSANGQEIATLLNAFSKLQKGHSKVFKIFGDRIVRDKLLVRSLSGKAMAIILKAFSKVNIPHYKLYQRLGQRIIDDYRLRSGLTFRDLADIIFAFRSMKSSTSIHTVKLLLDHLLMHPEIVKNAKDNSFAFSQILYSMRELQVEDKSVDSFIADYAHQFV